MESSGAPRTQLVLRNNLFASMTGSQIVAHDKELVCQRDQVQTIVEHMMNLDLPVRCSLCDLIAKKDNIRLLLEGKRNLQPEVYEMLPPEDGNETPIVRRKLPCCIKNCPMSFLEKLIWMKKTNMCPGLRSRILKKLTIHQRTSKTYQ